MRYSEETIEMAKSLRREGKTYGEIRQILKVKIPKSTLSEWSKGISLPFGHWDKISKLNISNLAKARTFAVEINKLKRQRMFGRFLDINSPLALTMFDPVTAKIALSMLCLGEASKSKSGSGFYLGNSDYRIIILFLALLKIVYGDHPEKIKATVQCRADQDPEELKSYWSRITNISFDRFYKPLIDPRTRGKPTKEAKYKGVLRIDYFDRKIQFDLESLADLIYNTLAGPVV